MSGWQLVFNYSLMGLIFISCLEFIWGLFVVFVDCGLEVFLFRLSSLSNLTHLCLFLNCGELNI